MKHTEQVQCGVSVLSGRNRKHSNRWRICEEEEEEEIKNAYVHGSTSILTQHIDSDAGYFR